MANPYMTAQCPKCGGKMDKRSQICRACTLLPLRASPLSKPNAAYVAGLLDGEGCFSISKTKTWLVVSVSIQMTSKECIDWLHRQLPCGSMSTKRGRTHTGRNVYSFFITSRAALRQVLPQVLPYLKAKGEVASLVLDYCERHVIQPSSGHKINGLPDWEVAIWQKVKALNSGKSHRHLWANTLL